MSDLEELASPKALKRVPQLSLNSNSNKITKPPSSKMTSKTHSSYSRPIDIHRLDREIQAKLTNNMTLKTKITTLTNQKQTQELQVRKLEDDFQNLKKKLQLINNSINELESNYKESYNQLSDEFDINSKQLNVQFNQRLNDLKENVSALVEHQINKSMNILLSQKKHLESDVTELKQANEYQKSDLNRKLIKLKEDFNKKKIQLFNQLDETLDGLNNDINTIKDTILSKIDERDALQNDLVNNLQQINKRLVNKLSQTKSTYENKELEIDSIKSSIIKNQNDYDNYQNSINDKKSQLELFKKSILEINTTLASNEFKRRVLHNKLQELKGNIRVYCRVRPTASDELSNIEYPDNEFNDDACQDLIISKKQESHSSSLQFGRLSSNTYKFQFDKIFSPDIKNEEIFDELSQLIQSSLDGYNVCVFAYGQTGSGKTWTMSHSETGMIPLSINKIFDDIEDLKSKNWTYNLEGQFVEIYNESIIDLLLDSSSSLGKHEIKHDDINFKTTITNVTSISISSKEQAHSILNRASKNRSTASTLSNERSSRSHSIFILKLKAHNSKTNQDLEGTLNLIDLAGSERLSQSQAKGDRLKETQSINKSLSSLGDVIYSLNLKNQNNNHIPFRNSKLTYLLKHSLGGDLKTLMFVNISPLQKNFAESINSLRFATKVNSTKIK